MAKLDDAGLGNRTKGTPSSNSPIEVEKLTRVLENGQFLDTHRIFVDASQKLYSWWSYRGLDPMKSNRGRRLDHIWATSPLKNTILGVESFVDFRIKTQPSDHIPILTNFDF